MRRIYYNKLIRDLIPEKIARHGGTCRVRTLSPKRYEEELLKKVGEEAGGLLAAVTKSEIVAELSDVLDVIAEIRRVKGITARQLAIARRSARQLKGGFTKRLYLEWSSDTGYRTNERRYGSKKLREAYDAVNQESRAVQRDIARKSHASRRRIEGIALKS